jgi:cysteine synthase A
MVTAALARGDLRRGGTVIETSSGTFALGLALVCNAFELNCIIVCDPAIDERLARRLSDLGCRLSVVTDYVADGGYQRSRLDRLHALLGQHEGAFWPNQYDNPDNPASYTHFADSLIEAFGTNIALVTAVGSGGTSAGLGRRLIAYDPSIPVIGVDTFGSVLFGHKDAPRLLRGLGNSLVPKNIDHSIFDEVHFLDAACAFRATRSLHSQHAAFVGPTTGAAWLVADWAATQHPNRTVIAVGPDDGHRYVDTVYDDVWLAKNAPSSSLPAAPSTAAFLSACTPPWARYLWERRRRNEVMELDASHAI